jgi:ribosomal-protein-alanine N-acetyltransferase
MQLRLQRLTAASEEDLTDLVALDQQCFGQPLWSRQQYARELESPNSDILGLRTIPLEPHLPRLLAYGCLWAILDEAHITIVAVHPTYQQHGFGTLILWGLLQTAVERGLHRATLEVRVSNTPAVALYQNFGFTVAGRRKNYYVASGYAASGEDALILWCSNLQSPAFLLQLQSHFNKVHQRWHHQGWCIAVDSL